MKQRNHQERASAVELAKQEASTACDREVASLKERIGAAQAKRDAQHADAAAEAERTRRACADEILRAAFDPKKGFPPLVAAFLDEPSRRGVVALHDLWRELDARAQAELGVGLSKHVLLTAFFNIIAADAPGAIGYVAAEFNFGIHDLLDAAGRFERAVAPADMEEAITTIEDRFIRVCKRAAGVAVNPDQAARHALRSKHATHGDLVEAFAQHDAAVAARELAKREQEPPGNFFLVGDGLPMRARRIQRGAPA